jgi:hypothetical protein
VVLDEIAGFNALGAAALSVGCFARQHDEKKGHENGELTKVPIRPQVSRSLTS